MTSSNTIDTWTDESASGGRSPELPYTVARSWFLISGASDLPQSMGSGADVDILDLEDAVPPAEKLAARAQVVNALHHRRAWVRINDVTTEFWKDDVAALRDSPGLLGVMLAKTDSASDVDKITEGLRVTTPVIAFIESAVGLEAAGTIATHPRVGRLAFGSGDFRMDVGAGIDRNALTYARSRLVVGSRAAGLPAPIDGPTVPDDQILAVDETEYAAGLGMTGRMCLHASHAATINTALSPTGREISDAKELITLLGPDGANARKGSDLPRLARAHRILDRARTFGLNALAPEMH
ncbi:HpcH/HpaI aldolase/citrate lyase family protein [Rhodococcus opacus]|uniref:HpcH/HpaI aldolase/citrate lyase family protein n=1 Tax=Rhodococcus opacus TaxID=37919 RepID=UPI0029554277|nr:CoA ester lyase [Rhodococcus opacus]MDV7087875.1 CoA ester lyase [Rhodococcus opacus]